MIRLEDGTVLEGEAEAKYLQVAQEAELVFREALGLYTIEGAQIWMDAPNRMLEGKSPKECVLAGRTKDVLDLLEALADGAFM